MTYSLTYSSRKVLIAEDDPVWMSTLVELLEEEGYQVICAGNGLKAWQYLQEMPEYIQAIISDITMPHMDGLSFIERVHTDVRYHDIPMIIQTGSDCMKQQERAIKSNVTHYLRKPYDPQSLLDMLRDAIQNALVASELKRQMQQAINLKGLMQRATFRLQTTDQAKNVAVMLASASADPHDSAMTLYQELCDHMPGSGAVLEVDYEADAVAEAIISRENKDEKCRLHFSTHSSPTS